MTALTRLTKAQLIEQVTRLTAENAQLAALHNTAAAALDKLRDDYVTIEERCVALDEENDTLRAKQHDHNVDIAGMQYTINRVSAERDTLQREVSMLRDVVESHTIKPTDESTEHHAPKPAPSRKLREPNEVERKRLAIIDQCHQLTKLHRSTVWYDWKYGEFRLRCNGAIQVLEVQPCAAI